MVRMFKALGEPTRLKIIKLLSVQSMCVCELSQVLEMLQPRISQHLKILKEADLVIEDKKGYWTYYVLNKKMLNNMWEEFTIFLDADLKNLEGYSHIYDLLVRLPYNEEVKEIKQKMKKNN